MTEMRRTLQSLTPNTRYVVRVRSVNEFGIVSPWSDALDLTTDADNSVPSEPTDLILDFDSPTLLVSWTGTSSNTDGTPFLDFASYEVTLTISGQSVSYNVSSNYFVYPLPQNQRDWGTPQPEMDVAIRVVDVTGNQSMPLTGHAVNEPPSDPVDPPQVSAGFTLVTVTVPVPLGMVDLDGFDIHHSTTGVGGPYTLLVSTTNGVDSYTHSVSMGTTHHYKYKVRDLFGQVSAFSPAGNATTSLLTADDTDPPDTPLGLGVSPDGVDFDGRAWALAHWDFNTEPDLGSYELRWRTIGGNFSSAILGADVISYQVNNLIPGITYEFQIRAVDLAGNASGWSAIVNHVMPQDTTPPVPPTGLSAAGGIESIFVSWNANSEVDLDHYELHAGLTAGFTPGPGNLVFSGNSTTFIHQVGSNETRYYRVRAVDHAGNESTFPAEEDGTALLTYIHDTTAPANPTGVTAVAGTEIVEQVSRTYVTASWTANTDPDLSGYQLQFKKSADAVWTTAVVPKGTTTHRVTGLLASTNYDFRVAAFDNNANISSFINATPFPVVTPADVLAPSAPGGINASAGIRTIVLQWTPPTTNTDASPLLDLDHYEIHIGTTAGFTPSATNMFSRPGQGSVESINKYHNGSTWVDLVPGTTYYLKMYAVDVGGLKSSVSSTGSATTGFLTDNDVQAGTIDADILRASNITAALTVTGGAIQTATSGARMVMDQTGMVGYATNGVTKNFEYKNSDGSISMLGSLTSGSTISGATIAGDSTLTQGNTPNWLVANGNAASPTTTGLWLGGASFGAAAFSVNLNGQMVAKKLSIDSVGMTPTDVILNSPSTVLTAGGKLDVKELGASSGRIGDVIITSSAATALQTAATLPTGTLTVGSTAAFAASGTIIVGTQTVTYSGKTAGTFTGCAGGTGTFPIGTSVFQGGKLQAGTIEGATINVANSGSLNFTGSGNITWQPGASGKIIVSNTGEIKSTNYTAGVGGSGWSLGPAGLEINQGTIRAPALQIGVSSENILRNSSFENFNNDGGNQAGVADYWVNVGTHTYAKEDISTGTAFRFQRASQKVTALSTTDAGVAQTLSIGSGLYEEIPLGSSVTISAWIYISATRTARLRLVDNTNTQTYSSSALTVGGGWRRISHTITTAAGVISSLTFRVWLEATSGDAFFIDGAQMELSSYASSYHPATLEIPDNYISAAYISSVSADSITTGTVDADVITVAATGAIQSGDYSVSPGHGYKLTATKLYMENGGVEIRGLGASGAYGGITMDSTSLRAEYGGVAQLLVKDTGVYMGGADVSTADIWVDTIGNRTVISNAALFQSAGGGSYTLEINSAAAGVGAKFMRLYKTIGGADSFYLTNDGLGYFSSGVIGAGTQPNGANKVKNSSFESAMTAPVQSGPTSPGTGNTGNLDYWQMYKSVGSVLTPTGDTNPTITRVVGGFHGDYACQIVLGGTVTGRRGIVQNPWVGGSNNSIWPASSVWALSFWVRQTTTAGIPTMDTNSFSAGGFAITPAAEPAALTGTWQRYSYRVTAPGADTTSAIRIAFSHNNSTILLDGVQLERGEIATPYLPMPEEVVGNTNNPMLGSSLRSSNYVAGTSGWALNTDGSAEFGNVTVRGTVNATAGTFTNGIVVGSSASSAHTIASYNFQYGSTGWIVRGDGYAEFRNVTMSNATVTGTINSTGGTLGSMTVTGTLSSGTISGSTINSATLNSATVNSGTITVGTLNIGNGVVHLTGGDVRFYDSGSNTMVRFVRDGTWDRLEIGGGSTSNNGLFWHRNFNRYYLYAPSASDPAWTLVGRLACQSEICMQDISFILRTPGDYNHRLWFNGSIDSPELTGHAGVRLYSVVADAKLDLQGDGNCVLYDNGGAWGMKGIGSSRTIKRDIKDFPNDALSKVMRLRPVEFKRKYIDSRDQIRQEVEAMKAAPLAPGVKREDHMKRVSDAEHRLERAKTNWEERLKPERVKAELGFVAEEVLEVEPLAVLPASGNMPMSLMYGQLTALLTKAIQELVDRVITLEKKVNK